jgi:hypothetical protein
MCGLGSSTLGFEALEARVLYLAYGVVEVKLGGKVPSAVVGVWTTNVVCVNGKEGIVWRHPRCPTVEKLHQKIELGGVISRGKQRKGSGGTNHVSHRISLEAKLLSEVKEDVFDFLFGERNLTIDRPGGVRLAGAWRCSVVDKGWGG